MIMYHRNFLHRALNVHTLKELIPGQYFLMGFCPTDASGVCRVQFMAMETIVFMEKLKFNSGCL